MRTSSEGECVKNKDIGILHNGKIFRPNKKRIVAKREGNHSDIEDRETIAIFYIEGILRT